MFSKEEIKEFIIKIGRKWLFPDITNKLTWFVVSIGASVILTPSPIKLVIYNWLIDTCNINYAKHFTLAEISSNNADYWIGLSLIFLAIIHNLVSKWLHLKESANLSNTEIQIATADKNLFEEFLQVFPSDSSSLHLVKEHNFGNSFNDGWLEEIEKFVYEWNCPEKNFLDRQLEELRHDLWEKCNEFTSLISLKSSPTGSGLMQSVVPDHVRGDWEWPDWVKKDVKEVNEKATEVATLHQEFILTTRNALSI